MSSPHPLNLAVLTQALHDLRVGQLRRCEAMGFSVDAIEALKHPALVSVLQNAKVSWCSVSVNCNVLLRLLKQGQGVEQEIEQIDRMLRLGASTEMVSEFHGLNHQEVALRREVIGMSQRKGRWPVPTEGEDSKLWECWSEGVKTRGIDPKDDAAMLILAMDLAEEQDLPLSVVWSAIRKWIDEAST